MIRYNWDQIEFDVQYLGYKISNETSIPKINSIIGVQRGGLVPAVMLSHLLNIPMTSLEWQTRDQEKNIDHHKLVKILLSCPINESVLIVDEIADTGETLKDIHKHVSLINARFSRSPVKVFYAVLVHKLSCQLDMPIFSARSSDSDNWIRFPWETE